MHLYVCVCESLSMHAVKVASRFTSARLRCICVSKSASKAFSSSSISIRINVISQAARGKTAFTQRKCEGWLCPWERESERGLIHGPDTNPLSQKGKKNLLLGGGLNQPLWLYFKTFSDAFLPAANVNKWAPVGNWGGSEGRMYLCMQRESCPDRL